MSALDVLVSKPEPQKRKRRRKADLIENRENSRRTKSLRIINDGKVPKAMQELDICILNNTAGLEINDSLFDGNENNPPKIANCIMRVAKQQSWTQSPRLVGYKDNVVFCRKYPHLITLEDQFSNLSDEMILNIFKWLPKPILVQCAEVCKRWKRLCYDESLWKRYDFGRRKVKPGVLQILMSRGVSALRLAMCDIKTPVLYKTDFSNRFGTRFCKLQHLDLSMATISVMSLAQLLSSCNQLKKLSLEHCLLDDDVCRSIAQNTHLHALDLALCVGLSQLGIYEICTSCVRLKELNLAWVRLTADAMETFSNTVPKNLMRLNISGHKTTLDDAAVTEILQRCPHLIELDVSDSPLLSFEFVTAIAEHSSFLQSLHISRCYNITTSSLLLLNEMKYFSSLSLFGVLNTEGEKWINSSMPEIKINESICSTVARPTTGVRRTSIWGLRVRD